MAQFAISQAKASEARSRIGGTGDLWGLLGLPLMIFLVIPLVALFLRTSPAELLTNLQDRQVTQAIILSIVTTLTTTIVTVIFGTPVAYLLARRRIPFRGLLDTIIDLPTVLPPAVAGVALLLAFGRRGLLGGWLDQFGLQVAFTAVAVIMAQTFIAAPLYIRSAVIGFGAIEPDLEQAAALDGANSWQLFRYVVLPRAWIALVSGSALTWARALGEFGATIIFAGNLPGRTQTMPLAIYLGFEVNLEVAITLSVILVGLSFLALILIKLLVQRTEF